jgi:hypothetical protein
MSTLMRRLPSLSNPLRLLRGRSADGGAREPRAFQVHLTLQFDTCESRQALEDASLRALTVVEQRAGDVALGVASGCDFDAIELELDFTVEASRSSELHERIGRVVRVLETEFPTAHERSSETEATAMLPPTAVPA